MSWLPIILLALVSFVAAAFVLRLPKSGWMLFGAALLFGLTGYAWQGYPGYPGAPRQATATAPEGSVSLIDARRQFFGPTLMPSYYVTLADGFARKGQFEDAANLLGNAVADNPADAEAWIAMGNALIDHAEGALTPAAQYAFARAEQLPRGRAAAAYFQGIGLLRAGDAMTARDVWALLLADAPDDAPWRAQVTMQYERLDRMVRAMEPGERPPHDSPIANTP
ncbi:MAG: tetratricopeptide repeat protein [Pontixanthobacter sp.]